MDFAQLCDILAYCQKLAVQQCNVENQKLIDYRRVVAKTGDKEAYKKVVLQKKAMQMYLQEKIQDIFQTLGVKQEQFEQSMRKMQTNPA